MSSDAEEGKGKKINRLEGKIRAIAELLSEAFQKSHKRNRREKLGDEKFHFYRPPLTWKVSVRTTSRLGNTSSCGGQSQHRCKLRRHGQLTN